jgi:hypothetical protein
MRYADATNQPLAAILSLRPDLPRAVALRADIGPSFPNRAGDLFHGSAAIRFPRSQRRLPGTGLMLALKRYGGKR